METVIAYIFDFLSSHGYWVLLPLMIVEGPITTLVAATLASTGVFNIYVVLFLAILGDYIGDVALYGIGRRYGQSFLSKRKARIYADLQQLFDEQGGRVIFFAKSTTGVVIPTFISAGAFRFSFKKFSLYVFMGGMLWSTALVIIGYFFGFVWRTLYDYTTWFGWIMSVLLIVFIAGILFIKRNNVQNFREIQKTIDTPLVSPNPNDQHYIEEPFLLHGLNNKGVLLIHGWSATPYETQHLAQTLNDAGYTTYSVLLKGHGKTPAHLKGVVMEDWMQDVERSYGFLKKQGLSSISIVGNSLGGNLALLLAERQPDIEKIILTGPLHTLRNETTKVFFLWILSFFQQYKKKAYPKNTYMSPETLTHFVVYPIYPIHSSLEAFRTIRRSRKSLKKIHQPVLMIQAADDHLVVDDNTKRFYDNLASKQKEVMIVQKLYHNFVFNRSNTAIFKKICDFISS